MARLEPRLPGPELLACHCLLQPVARYLHNARSQQKSASADGIGRAAGRAKVNARDKPLLPTRSRWRARLEQAANQVGTAAVLRPRLSLRDQFGSTWRFAPGCQSRASNEGRGGAPTVASSGTRTAGGRASQSAARGLIYSRQASHLLCRLGISNSPKTRPFCHCRARRDCRSFESQKFEQCSFGQ